MSNQVLLAVDGSCLGNPGVGGYAAILQWRGVNHTTNNRMELTAVLVGLQALKRRCQVTVVTDSHYAAAVLKGSKAKANLDLVQPLRQLTDQHDVTVQTVPGHSGHALNERCNRLAQAGARRYQAMES